nr:ABC transporter substrate-binding protein [Candidatus Symbiopectobacterium sp. 'North America']
MLRVISALFISCLACSLPVQGTSVPARIVVAGGALAEIVYAVGSGSTVVGVDQTTTYPPETQTLAKVSHWQQLNVDGMLSLQPSLVVTWQDAQPQGVLDQLRQAANLLQKIEQGEALIAQINADLQGIERTAGQKTPVKVLFLLSVAGNGVMVAGKGTVADGMITLAGEKVWQPTLNIGPTAVNR